MANALLLVLAVIFALCLLSYFTLDTRQRETVFSSLQPSRRKTNDASTSPRAPPKEKHESLPTNAQGQQRINDLFPPHRRASLAQLPPDALESPGKSAKELSERAPNYTKLTPDKAVCNTDNLLDHTTATGFTVDEIRRLGDFPDYAPLSGIPLPNEYKDFDIRTAMPRPYRPLRWPYHQTMCMLTVSLVRSASS